MIAQTKSSDAKFQVLHVLFCIGLFFASFDIALNVEIADITFRTAQIAQGLFVLLFFIVPKSRNESQSTLYPIGFKWLLFWGFFLIIWTPNTYHLTFSVAYTLYFIFSVIVIFGAVQVYSVSEARVYALLRAYIACFVLLASFGLLQFAAGLFGVDLLVEQWWKQGQLPRLNGVSYEPSYYATYLLAGWGMLAWMLDRGTYLFSRHKTQLFFAILSLAIILSSSRMAILIIGLYFAYYVLKELWRIFSEFKVRKSFLKVSAVSVLIALSIAVGIIATVGWDSLRFLLFGTGLAGSADHSASIRFGQMEDTLQLIKDSPIIGYGLGGIISNISVMRGQEIADTTGMNVTAEIFAASGAFGFVFFALYLGTMIIGCFAFRSHRDKIGQFLAAAGLGLILLYVVVNFNQNIMRVYFWNHVAVIAVLYAFLEQREQISQRISKRSLRDSRDSLLAPRQSA